MAGCPGETGPIMTLSLPLPHDNLRLGAGLSREPTIQDRPSWRFLKTGVGGDGAG